MKKKSYLTLLALLSILVQENYVSAQNKRTVRTVDQDEIPLTEDLMREHGVLNRLLLVYEEIIRRLDSRTPFPLPALESAVNLIAAFIENYHEKLEEDYIFPLFEKNKKEVRLVKTLRLQHARGREITAELVRLITAKRSIDLKQQKTVRALLHKFITMYRPHEAREDTVLFPQIRSLISAQEFAQLSATFEAMEHKLFGSDGFEDAVQQVAAIEEALGIYALEQFTPKL